jgi:hypothetical protein
MKLLITMTAWSLVLGTSVGTSAYALQSQEKEKDKPASQGEPPKQDKPDKEKDKDKEKEKGQQPDRREPDRDRDRPQDPKQQQQRDREHDQQDRDRAQQQDRARTQQDRDRQDRDRAQAQDRERRSPEAAGQRDNRDRGQSDPDRRSSGAASRQGRHIPDDRFRASFGREHTFHIQRGRSGDGGGESVEGPRFQYGGYWFEYTDAWPSDWRYDDDDFYIDYMDDDYYLYDLRHPGVRILVIVVE